MLFKTLLYFSIVFVLGIAVMLGLQVSALAQQIGQVDRTRFVSTAEEYKEADITTKVVLNGRSVSVELAETEAQREQGLMNRESLDAHKGMLFIFPRSAKHSFWMKNTKIPLDMIWIDNTLVVVDVKHSAPPCTTVICPSYVPQAPARYVLEVNGGWAQANDVKIGTLVSFR